MNRLYRNLLAGIAFSMIAACQNTPSATPVPTATLQPNPAPTRPATAISKTVATPPATSSPILINPQVLTLADHLNNPDDLLLTPDGSIYVSDVGDGTIRQYTNSGGMQLVLSGLVEPEGMILLPDGAMIIAEQGKNRLVRYDPSTQSLMPFLNLTNTTGLAGVDGITWDARSQTIIVPDSPNGNILRVSLDGKTVTQVASGFARPTDAWVEPDGSILVVDENGNSLNRIHTDGSIEKLAALSIPDDVIEDSSGNILVVTLGDHAVHLILKGTNQDETLATRLSGPQGIIFGEDGNLIVTDPGNHRLVELVIH